MARPLENLIPEARLDDVRRALAAAFPGQSIETAATLSGGVSAQGVYRFATRDGDYVLRLDGPPDGFRDPARQYACHALAAEAGVAPRLVHADPVARVSIGAFAAGSPAEGDCALRLTALARAVRRLHDGPRFPPLLPYLDAMQRLYDGFAASGVAPASKVAAARAGLDRIAAVWPAAEGDVVASHNDLHPGNVLFDGTRIAILDWESAFAADRHVDVASMLNFFAAGADEEALLLHAYFGRSPGEADVARVLLMRQVNRLFYGAVLLLACVQERPGLRLSEAQMAVPRFAALRAEMASLVTSDGRQRFGCAFLNEALIGMGGPAFEAALVLAPG